MNLEANKKAREEAEVAFSLVTEAAAALPDELRQRYWEVLYFRVGEAAGKVAPEEPGVTRMSDAEAKAFERTLMPWGKYIHKRICDIDDLGYLFWLADKPDEFLDGLRRYLRSDRVLQDQGG